MPVGFLMVTCTIISKCVGVDASGKKFGIREGTEVEMIVDPSTTDISNGRDS